MLETKNLGFWYQDPANALFMDVNLQFEPGNMYAILGKVAVARQPFCHSFLPLNRQKKVPFSTTQRTWIKSD